MYEVRPYPRPLPDEMQQAIFAFNQYAFPGLVLASCVEGNQSERTFSRMAPPELTTIQDIETFTPNPYIVDRPYPAIHESVTDRVIAFWQRHYAKDAAESAHASATPNRNENGKAIWSPFTEHEQIIMAGYVQECVHRNVNYKELCKIYKRQEITDRVFPHLSVLLLSTVSDFSAMPRVMAGMDFDRERTNVKTFFSRNVNEQGIITPPDSPDVSPQYLLHSIPWVMPTRDLTPHFTHRGTIGTKANVVLTSQILTIFKILTHLDPKRFLTPADELPASALRSPYQVNSRHVLTALLDRLQTGKMKLLDRFLQGEKIEPPQGVSVKSVSLPRAAKRPAIYRLPPEPEPIQEQEHVEQEEKPVLHEPEVLAAAHQDAMESLRENELGQKLIALVQKRGGVVEVARASRLDPKQLPLTLTGRLRNIARILSDMQPDGEGFPPKITPPKNPAELIHDMTGGFAGRLQSLHLLIEPESAVPATLKHEVVQALRIGVLVGKKKTGYKQGEFSGAYFVISIKSPSNLGVRPVVIDREENMSPTRANRLAEEFILTT